MIEIMCNGEIQNWKNVSEVNFQRYFFYAPASLEKIGDSSCDSVSDRVPSPSVFVVRSWGANVC